ncbi:MAG: mechanosensitive ion channel domain-containing protein [bacterium]
MFKILFKKSFLSIFLFIAAISSYIFFKIHIVPALSVSAHKSIKKYIITIFIFCIAYIIQQIIDSILEWYKKYIAVKTPSHLDDRLLALFSKVDKVLIWAIAIIIILPFYGINTSALVATLGVSTLAIALAAQDTIANIISGFLILIDAPFREGDTIKLPSGEKVNVLTIGVRRSRFLGEDKTIIIVPNVDLSKSKIVNYTYGEENSRQ